MSLICPSSLSVPPIPPTTVFIQLCSAIVFVLPVPQDGSSKALALAIRQTVRGRKHSSLFLILECILTSFSDKLKVGVRWAGSPGGSGAAAVAQSGFLPSKVPLEIFSDGGSSLTCKVNMSSKHFFFLLHSQEEFIFHSSFLHPKDPAANYSSIC